MPPFERKLGIKRVIEGQFLPLFGAMTLGADTAIASIVCIIDQVATDTLFRCIFIVIISMT